ncbi:MAG: hypothetical protein IAB81_05220 [Bacteroidetes bacterium]|uniref:Uncharacterized protein n=1 Tax=Candidatus Merdivivens pullicola TaxID=2840872 RepID=A0A9D9NGL2_9BACT|nr:hypothetical protein [Candidatus Merdivivens pullicola]
MENYVSSPQIWRSGVKKAFYGFIGVTFLGILAAIFSVIPVIGWILNIVTGILIIVSYVYFLMGLKDMRASLINLDDAAAVSNIYTGSIIGIVAAVVSAIPFISVAGGVLAIISYVMMLVGFYRMRNSISLPELAKSGAFILFIGMILDIVGSLLGFIPIAGPVVEAIISLAVFVLAIMGWKRISDSEI